MNWLRGAETGRAVPGDPGRVSVSDPHPHG